MAATTVEFAAFATRRMHHRALEPPFFRGEVIIGGVVDLGIQQFGSRDRYRPGRPAAQA